MQCEFPRYGPQIDTPRFREGIGAGDMKLMMVTIA